MKIIDYISRKENYGSTRPLGKIKYIVIHYTSNDGDTAKNNCIYFRREIVKASAHYFVDDNSIYRSVPDNYNAYSVGAKKYRHPYCRNSNSISIELCDTRRNGTYDFTSKTIQNAVELTKELMQKYNIPIDNVIRHYDVTGKVCPRPFVEDRQAWESFKSKLITPVNTNKYKVNDAVQTRFQVRVVSATDNDHFKVESNGYYFELHKTMVSPINSDMIGDVIQRGVIFAILNHDTYGIEILDRQFQIKEYYIEKKL